MSANRKSNKNKAKNSVIKQESLNAVPVNKESPSETPGFAIWDWGYQLSEGLRWLHERAWSLTALMLIITALYLSNFIRVEKVPLSIASPAIITALPILFIFVLLFVIVLVGVLLSPTMMLFSTLKKNNSNRLIQLLVQNDPVSGRAHFSKYVIAAWLSVPIMIGVTIMVIWVLHDLMGYPTSVSEYVLLVAVPLAMVVVVRLFIAEGSLELRFSDVSVDFWFSVFMSVMFQFSLVVYVMLFAIRIAQYYDDNYGVLFLAVIGCVGLFLLQLFAARYIATFSQPSRSLIKSFVVGMSTVAVLGVFPPTASWIVGGVFQFTASGMRSCAVLAWTSNSPAEINAALYKMHSSQMYSRQMYSRQSLPLRILIDIDGYYLVRLKDDESKLIYYVPRKNVSSIDDCQP